LSDVLVVGAGLIGTSVALALTEQGRAVTLGDLSPERVEQAIGRGAGRAWDGQEQAPVVVAAVPPGATAALIATLQQAVREASFTHVSSVQSSVQRAVEALGCDLGSICGGHPMAGSERSGPGAASAELFVGRSWAVCPSGQTSARALRGVRELAESLGATTVTLSAAEHDQAVALVSHLPQVAASAVAALLPGARYVSELAGPGLSDTTRIAASEPALWVDVLSLNAGQLSPLVRALAEDLLAVAEALTALSGDPAEPGGHLGRQQQALAALSSLLERGNTGRALVPVARGTGVRGQA